MTEAIPKLFFQLPFFIAATFMSRFEKRMQVALAKNTGTVLSGSAIPVCLAKAYS
jgi:hypothetical protein